MIVMLLLIFFIFTLYLLLKFVLCSKPIEIPIKNRHVFISGGSSGIGLALAHEAASQGAQVSILAIDQKQLEEAQISIRNSTGVEVAIFYADVRDFNALEKVVNEAGPIDVLICNHGVFMAREVELQEIENVYLMIDVNLTGTFNLIKAALLGMKMNRSSRGPASIALMSSQAGQIGIYGYTAYSASKFGLRGLAESLQLELLPDNIHITMIFPPDTRTPALEEDRKSRPKMTKMMARVTTTGMNAGQIAKISFDGIKSGKFLVYCNVIGFLLCLATADNAPQRSPLMALFEVMFAGIYRLGCLAFLWYFNSYIKIWSDQKKINKTK